MDVASVEGFLVVLVVVLPGGLGDGLMRFVTRMPAPRDNWSRLFSAIAWSVAALVAVELAVSLFSRARFGSYLIAPLTTGPSLGAAAVDLAGRYAWFALAAIGLPPVLRFMLKRPWLERWLRGQTLAESSVDRLLRYVPPSAPWLEPGSDPPYVRIGTTNGNTIEGWARWASNEFDEDAAYIVRANESLSVTWVPLAAVECLTYVDIEREGPFPQEGE